ncbi:hypothetical protein MWU75_03515 [Ornithinimicrobium sp. F0845]|uniref:hypothetical protein n=1 Tax=Ornithinimicrobium sp. F0845 TaxID=2926412 RepID=UPI001FF5588F|nr:hypothetical protein [Ornithinimicrobium sp. F0845]MCK0111206.1 hypothetical protein [Ornithinimicrobium sp. F0845]
MVREVTPAESREALLACLGERGWVADATGGISIAPGQEDSYATATYECTAAYPVQERYLRPLAPQAWVLIYDHFTSVAVPCLEDEGLPVPGLPSREVFLADPETHWAEAAPQRANLNAAIAATGDDPDEFLARVCPLTPPAESLYPEVPEPD